MLDADGILERRLAEVSQLVTELLQKFAGGDARRDELDKRMGRMAASMADVNEQLGAIRQELAQGTAKFGAIEGRLGTHLEDHRSAKRSRFMVTGSVVTIALASIAYLLSAVSSSAAIRAKDASQDTTIAAVALSALASCYYAEEADTMLKVAAGSRAVHFVRLRALPSCAALDAGLQARLDGLLHR